MANTITCNDTKLDKKLLIKKLATELPALRAMLGRSQAELGELIGVSRQTYSMIETQKKEMGWNIYMSLIMVFNYNPKTASFLEFTGAFPKELQLMLKEE